MIDWDDIWEGSIILLVTCTISLGLYAVAQPHNVDYYYLSQASEGRVCTYAHWTWHLDEKAGCFNTPQEATDFVAKANQAIKH